RFEASNFHRTGRLYRFGSEPRTKPLYGRCRQWVETPDPTWTVLNWTGRLTGGEWFITPAPTAIPFLSPNWTRKWEGRSISLNAEFTITFPCGLPTARSSTLFRAFHRMKWTSGAFVRPADLLSASRSTTRALRI